MTNIEILKPKIIVGKGTVLTLNSDNSFSSVLHRKRLFSKFKIVNNTMDKSLIEKVNDIVSDSNINEWHHTHKKLTDLEELQIKYEAQKYMLNLYLNSLMKD